MLLDLLPQLGVLLDANLLGVVVDELVQTAQVHVLGKQRDNVLVESLPVGVLEMVFLALLSLLEHDANFQATNPVIRPGFAMWQKH